MMMDRFHAIVTFCSIHSTVDFSELPRRNSPLVSLDLRPALSLHRQLTAVKAPVILVKVFGGVTYRMPLVRKHSDFLVEALLLAPVVDDDLCFLVWK